MRKVITIDCQYMFPRFAAAYLIVEDGQAAFVDNNTARAVPLLLTALEKAGLTPDQVAYVIITHVHLDHAAGTAELMKACPRAKLLAHPRAVPHMIDPSRLEVAARAVYSDEIFVKHYGRLDPVSESRVRAMADGETLPFGEKGDRQLRFIHTRGHANHHFCIYDSGTQAIFTGDAFGLCYPTLQDRGFFILPSTSPTDFDPVEAKLSLTKILDSGAKSAFLTHFGEVSQMKEAADQLRTHLDFSEDLLHRAIQSSLPPEALDSFCENELARYYESKHPFTPAQKAKLKLDHGLNAAGIAHVARKRRGK